MKEVQSGNVYNRNPLKHKKLLYLFCIPITSYLKLLVLLFFFSCSSLRKQESRQELVFKHTFAGKPFQLNTPYITNLGDTIMFTKLKYYISNINQSAEKEGYYLIDYEKVNGTQDTISYMPKTQKTSSKLSFGIGIDSLRNSSGEQKGVLDPLNGMFWTWEDGYVFFKAEGYFLPASTKRMSFVIHIGKNENYLPLAYPTQESRKIIEVKLEKLFGGFEGAGIDIRLSNKPLSIMAGEKARKIKLNLRAIFEN
jgi:hypothetical protein